MKCVFRFQKCLKVETEPLGVDLEDSILFLKKLLVDP